MSHTLAALEFDRILGLVAHFARSQRGKTQLLERPPRPDAEAGVRAFRLAADTATFVASQGTLTFDGLDDVELLEDGESLDAVQIARLVGLVRRIVSVRSQLAVTELGPELAARRDRLPLLDGLLAACDVCLGPTGEVLDSASAALARARASRERGRQRIVAALEDVRRRHRQLAAPFTVRRERYCLPVPAGERHAVKGLVLDSSGSGATLFVEPLEVVDLNNELAEATATVREEEERILRDLTVRLGRHRDDLLAAADLLAELDAFQARLLFGRAAGGTLLEPGGGDRLRLVGARHPLLDPRLAGLRQEALGEAGSTRQIVPLDLDYPEATRLLLLSGPNAGGKTVALKTIGLTVLMAQAGIPVLAEAGSVLPPLRRVWCHIGDEQNLLTDLSTFTGAMHATASLLRDADSETLVLYDELGSGTDPEEGAALAAALLEDLAARGCWTVATAHLVTVAAHLEEVQGAANAAMGFDESTGTPTYELIVGLPGRSRGLAIAAGCSVSASVLERARSIVSRGFLSIDAYLERLQAERERLAAQRERLAARERAAAQAEAASVAEARRLRDEADAVRSALAAQRDDLRQRARQQLDAALAEIERLKAAGELPGKRRMATIRHRALDLGDDQAPPAPPTGDLGVGDTVRLRGSRAVARVAAVEGDRVQLATGGGRMWVEAAACEVVHGRGDGDGPAVTVAGPETAARELKLIGLTQDEAMEELDRFVDRALLAGVRQVRIVHGHGAGTLRRLVREYLRAHPAVASFSHPPQARGGTGATEAELE